MDSNQNTIVLEVDERPATAASERANRGLDSVEQTVRRVSESSARSFGAVGDTIVRFSDRSAASMDRSLSALQRKLSLFKEPAQRLQDDRAGTLSKFSGDEQRLARAAALYDQLGAAQKRADNSALLERAQRASKGAEAAAGSFAAALNRTNRERDREIQSIEKEIRLLERSAQLAKPGANQSALKRQFAIEDLGPNVSASQLGRFKAAQDQLAKLEHSGGSFEGFGEKIKAFIDQPFEAATGTLTGFLGKAGIIGKVVAEVTTVLGAFAVTGFEAAKSLGEFGVGARDVEIRTGFSAREVGQFSFAARAAGQDVSIFERTMRGLTEALTDNSGGSDKAREALTKLGVIPRDLEGNLKPTSDILFQISEGLNRLPNAVERNKVALDLFKKSGIEAVPVILDLIENLKSAPESSLFNQVDIDRGIELQKKVTAIETAWESFKRSVKESIVVKVEFVSSIGGFLGGLGNKIASGIFGSEAVNGAIDTATGKPFPSIDQQVETERKRLRDYDERQKITAAGGEQALVASAKSLSTFLNSGLEGAQAKLALLKKDYDEARTAAQTLATTGKALPELAEQHRSKVAETLRAYERQNEAVKLLQNDESKRVANLEKIRDLTRQGSQFLVIGDGPTQVVEPRTGLEPSLTNPKVTPRLARPGEITFEQQLRNERFRIQQDEELRRGGLQPGGAFNAGDLSGNPILTQTPPPDPQETFKRSKDERLLQLAAFKAETQAAERIVELRAGPGGEFDTARKIAALREVALKAELQSTGDITSFRERSLQNEIDLRLKNIELEERQLDEVKKKTETLLETLFTAPKNFARQLAETVRSAVLKPITEELSERIAGPIKSLVFGSGGQGGIAGGIRGLFGAHQGEPPLKLATDLNTAATADNTAALAAMTAAMSGGTPVFESPVETKAAVNDSSHVVAAITTLFSSQRQQGRNDAKLDQPNHLGDLNLINGAVPVFLPSQQRQSYTGLPFATSGATAALAIALGLGGLGGGSSAQAASPEFVQSTIDFGSGVTSTGPGQIFGRGSILGGPGGTSGFAGPLSNSSSLFGMGGFGGGTSSIFGPGSIFGGPGGTPGFSGNVGGGGILSRLSTSGSGILGALRSLGNIGIGGANSIPVGIGGDTAAQAGGIPGLGDISALKTGGLFAGKVGGLAGGALLAGGGTLVMDGLRRGGFAGLGEDIGGGAAIGLKFGGPIGALIGAAAGAVAGTIRLFIHGKDEEVRKKVRSVYGVDIADKGIRQQIVNMAKQGFGGNIDAAIRSVQVRQLIELYAQTTGQNAKGIVDHAQPSIFSNQNGKLSELPTYFNGSPVMPGDTRSTVGIPQMGNNGQYFYTPSGQGGANIIHTTLQLDAEATQSILQGQAVQVINNQPRLISSATTAGQSQSSTQRSAAASMLNPSLLTS